ncbi:hypothetical protein C8J56DRAFT_951613 [Mycena floridula]|nr:hypothetical protein C8J56DRAFT_951613 [Mycena floridula]
MSGSSSSSASVSGSTGKQSSGIVPQVYPPGPGAAKVALQVDFFFPILPEEFARYARRRTAFGFSGISLIVPAGVQSFQNLVPPRPGWLTGIHPDGARYFTRKHQMNTIVTDEDIFDSMLYEIVSHFIDALDNYVALRSLNVPPGSTIVLDPVKVASSKAMRPDYHFKSYRCGYYLVAHDTQSIFWVHDFPLPEISGGGLRGINQLYDLEHYINAQYWIHCNYFPSPMHLNESILHSLRDRIIHSIGDDIMSATSTIPFNRSELESLLALVDNIIDKSDPSKLTDGISATVCRMMQQFSQHQFINHYGQHCARLDRFQSVHGEVPGRTLLFRLLSPLLFSAPESHKHTLDNIFVDDLVSSQEYTAFVDNLTAEWREVVLYATVVLNVNVAFLAIQSVDTSTGTSRSVSQVCSYVSTISSIGSIMLGLVLIRKTRGSERNTASQMAEFLITHKNVRFGFEILAILYSLPNALFTWGMMAFIAAFSFLCFNASDLTTRVLAAVAEGLIGALITSTLLV